MQWIKVFFLLWALPLSHQDQIQVSKTDKPNLNIRLSSYLTKVVLLGNYSYTLFEDIVDLNSPIVVGTGELSAGKVGWFRTHIIEVMENRTLNLDLILRHYLNHTIWKYDSKGLLLYHKAPENYEAMLKACSAVGLFNIAIMWPQVHRHGYVFVYHNPFPKENSTVTFLEDPKSWEKVFPDKSRNLYGHQLTLTAIHKPPNVIVRGEDVLGINRALFDLMMTRWNATYRIPTKVWLERGLNPVLSLLPMNRYPYYSMTEDEDYDFIPANDQDQARIMVKYKTSEFTLRWIGKYFFNAYGLLTMSVFGAYCALHYCFFHRKKDLICMFGCSLVPVAVRQPVWIKLVTWKEKVFFASALWFAFFTIGAFECQITSSLVANIASGRIRTIAELEHSNMRIYSDVFTAMLLRQDRYNLSDALLDRIEVTNEIPWTDPFNDHEYAFIIGMAQNDFFFKSAFNRNCYGSQRFYLLDHVITTTPFLYLFPSQSPYQRDFQETHGRIEEAGLRQYWETKALQRSVWSVWRSFSDAVGVDERKIANSNRITFAFIVLGVGYSLSLISFCAEILWWKYLMRIKGKGANRKVVGQRKARVNRHMV